MGHLFFAQADGISSLAGSSGWVGAGLLGLVLAWLFFVHLPGKDKLIKDIIDKNDEQIGKKDAQVEAILIRFSTEALNERMARKEASNAHRESVAELVAIHERALKTVCDEFRTEMAAERQACERRVEQLAKHFSDRG